MKKKKVKKLVVSDLHLGYGCCRAALFMEVVPEYSFRELVVAGDLFHENPDFSEDERHLLSYLLKNKDKLRCLLGNHGEGLEKKILGIEVQKEYEWEDAGKKFLAIHGHIFDHWWWIFNEVPLVDTFFSRTVDFFKKFHVFGYGLKEQIDNGHTEFSDRTARRAAKYARRYKDDVIICGHVHKALYREFRHRGKKIDYWNCGHWTGPCSFLTQDYQGVMQLHELSDLGYVPEVGYSYKEESQ